MAVSGSIDAERRRKDLVELLEDGGEISIEDARVRFDVSAMTIRRDLEILELDGLVRRVRGGAIAPLPGRSYDDRLATRTAAKRTVARKALTLVPRRGAIAFDASTTVHELADSLSERDDLTVTTNSLQTFQSLGLLITGVFFTAASSKLGVRSIGTALSLDLISTLITELPPDDARLDPYRDLVELI